MGRLDDRETLENHAFEVALDEPAADHWEHVLNGDGNDSGLVEQLLP